MKEQNCLRRFLFEEVGVRGEWVRLQESWQATKHHQKLNSAVESQLGQALAAVVLLSATIKFEGTMILQAQGDGSLRSLVAHSSHDRKIRGLVRYNSEVTSHTLPEMMGQGRLVLTVESKNTSPYQGVVALEGNSLAEMLHTYFMQSEQLQTRLWLFANQTHAVGLLLQELPAQVGYEADWERIETLASTITEAELFSLDCEEVLYRLFNQEKVRVFPAESVEFSCHCSRKKISHTLKAMGQADLEAILKEREIIEVDCEFCGEKYCFNKTDVANLFY
jgi:molecular chaperone Hsp33